MNIFDLLESPGMGRPRDTNGIQSAADQSAASVIGSGTTKREAKKKPVTMMGVGVKESVEEAAVKPNFKMPPESLQDKMYRQHQELRKQRGSPSPEEYKQRIAQKQAEIDALKESSYASDKNYKQADAYKNYNIYVGKNPFVKQSTGEKFYIAVTNIGKHEFKEKGVTQQEAVDAIQNKIDEILNAQQRVSAGAILDFNVKFATDILGNPRESFYAKVINVGGEPKLIIAGKEMLDFGRELVGLGFKPSALRIDPESETATALPSISYSSRQIKDTGLIANGRYEIGDMKTDNDGNRVFDLTYHSTAHTKSDKMRLNKPAVTVGTTRSAEVSEGILDRGVPKMPKPRNPADQVLRNKVNAGGRHLDKKRRQDLNPKHKHKDPMAEGEVLQFPKSPQDKNVRAKLEQRLLAAFNQIVDYADDNGIDILEKNAPLYSKLFSKYDTEDATLDPEQAMARNEPIEVVAQVVKEVEHIAKHIDEYLDNMWGDTFNESSVDEGWKSAVAGAALAGSMALGGMAHAAEPVVGQGQSQNMQMAVDMAKHNARVKYLKTVHGDNFQDKQMPEHRYGKLELKPNDKGGYIATVPLIVDAETQNESLRPGERHHFETDPVTGKRVYKGIRGDQQDAPQRAKDDPAARADQERKAHIAHDRGLTEQAVKITDYDTWSDEVKALGGEIHTQRDRNLLVAQSWDGEEIGKFHLGKSMGFINRSSDLDETIRKMGSQYRLLSKKGKNLGTFDSKAGAEKHEREVQYFKHKNIEEGSEDSQEQHVAAMLNRRSRGPQVATHRTLFDLSDEYNSLPAGSTVRHVEGSKKLYVHLVDGSPKNIYRIDKNHVEPLDRTDEGWKGKLAGAALAGAAALGGGDVDAQNINLPGPQVSYVAHVTAEANGREVHRTVNLGSNYSSEQEAYDDIESSLQAKGITRYNINIEQKYDAQYYPGSNQPRGGTATGREYSAPGIGDMVIKHIGREIRAGIPDRGGYATGGTNQGQRPRDGSQWWKDQLPRIKEDELAEDVESHLYLMSRAGYDIVQEAWSDKYKRSINCSNPKGFSQKAHCAGKKKNEAVAEQASVCTECGGAAYSDSMLAEKKDACYSKVKSRYKVWPSAYASGALVRCRKVGAANWGNKSKK